jgi:hypothetical protein
MKRFFKWVGIILAVIIGLPLAAAFIVGVTQGVKDGSTRAPVEDAAEAPPPSPEGQPGSTWSNPIKVVAVEDSGYFGVRVTDTSASAVRIVSVSVNGGRCSAAVNETLRQGDTVTIADIRQKNQLGGFMEAMMATVATANHQRFNVKDLKGECGDTPVGVRVKTDQGYWDYQVGDIIERNAAGQ